MWPTLLFLGLSRPLLFRLKVVLGRVLAFFLGDDHTSSWSFKIKNGITWLKSPWFGLNNPILGQSLGGRPLGSWVLSFTLLDWLL